jgi:hypothetical protein
MGLLYTKFYLDFEKDQWKEISQNPVVFETIEDNVTIEIFDTSQIEHKLKFRKGGKIQLIRILGKFRLTWADEDLLSEENA